MNEFTFFKADFNCELFRAIYLVKLKENVAE